MACGSKTLFTCIGFVVLILLIQEVDSGRGGGGRGGRGGYRSRSSRYSGTSGSGGSLGKTGAIILGSVLGGLAALGILLFILFKCGAFKDCCKTPVAPEKDTAYMYNPSAGPDGSKIQEVSTTKTPGMDGHYAPKMNTYDYTYPPPPPAYY